jgi:hypothetical protein
LWTNHPRPAISASPLNRDRQEAGPRVSLNRALCITLLFSAVSAHAGPVEFGLSEFNSAVASRNLKWKVKYEVTIDPPETYRIEPYKYGGAHVTGGDLRGVMYGLLELADQIRTTGRMKQVHAAPSTPVRGIRLFVRAADLNLDWKHYLETLTRDRFNRFTLIFLDPPYTAEQKLAAISQLAADYGIDFTLGIWEHDPAPHTHDALPSFLAACPLIRTIEWRSDSTNADFYRNSIFKPLREAGRRVALAPAGSLTTPAFLKAAAESGIALRVDPSSWPASFEIEAPRDLEAHGQFYSLWGRLGYDAKLKPQHSEKPEEFAAAARALTYLAAAYTADPNTYLYPDAAPSLTPVMRPNLNDWIASVVEAVHARLNRMPSAKLTPLSTADQLLGAAASLDKTPVPDFQLIARLARYHAHKQRAAYFLELFNQTKDSASLDRFEEEIREAGQFYSSDPHPIAELISALRPVALPAPSREIPALPKPIARPQVTDTSPKTAPSNQPLNLTIQIPSAKDVPLVRLYWRAIDQSGPARVMEKPAAPSVTFTIAQADLPPSDLIYFFEILNHENSGWFEPDPATATPYHVVRIELK